MSWYHEKVHYGPLSLQGSIHNLLNQSKPFLCRMLPCGTNLKRSIHLWSSYCPDTMKMLVFDLFTPLFNITNQFKWQLKNKFLPSFCGMPTCYIISWRSTHLLKLLSGNQIVHGDQTTMTRTAWYHYKTAYVFQLYYKTKQKQSMFYQIFKKSNKFLINFQEFWIKKCDTRSIFNV